MSDPLDTQPADPVVMKLPRAGDVEPVPSGYRTYLAPLPLPTLALPYNPYVSHLNDTYLDFGCCDMPQVVTWRMVLGGPFAGAAFVLFGVPIMMGLMVASLCHGCNDIWHVMKDFFLDAFEPVMWMSSLYLGFGLALWFYEHEQYAEVIPTRFNRQRREVCFWPKGEEVPLFVPWESLSAWVVQVQDGPQYGVSDQDGMGLGIGFHHDGELLCIDFMRGGVRDAISRWEAVRSYMEYEIHDLKRIKEPMDLQGPDDPFHEGMHTLRNERAWMHRLIREKKVGWGYGVIWYLYHVMSFWSLPNRIVEWEVRRIARVGRKKLPEAMQAWSESIPEDQWARPSDELIRLSKHVNELSQRNRLRSITDIFAEVYRYENNKAGGLEGKSRRSRK
jgi:hypothetical protein